MNIVPTQYGTKPILYSDETAKRTQSANEKSIKDFDASLFINMSWENMAREMSNVVYDVYHDIFINKEDISLYDLCTKNNRLRGLGFFIILATLLGMMVHYIASN